MKKVLMIYNSDDFAYRFTLEIIEEIIKNGNILEIILPLDSRNNYFIDLPVKIYYSPIQRRGKNIFNDLKLLNSYKKIIKESRPDVIFSFTIKPNIYGSIVANKFNIPIISRVSGLGTSFQKKGLLFLITKFLYRKSFKNNKHVFFENSTNSILFNKEILKLNSYSVLPGSGVNITNFKPVEYPENNMPIKFLFLGRIMKDKGFEEYIYSAQKLKTKFRDNIEFHVAGDIESYYINIVEELQKNNIIKFFGFVTNPEKLINESHCIVLPSYHEGLSNVMLEAQALERPVIGTNVAGIKETFIANETGILCEVKDEEDLCDKIEFFYLMDYNDKKIMGQKGRVFVSSNFSRKIVVDEYIKQINKIN
ncbi:glycosyltransferase family 4 protein [Haploplasma modicum]|uniref:glycosyltransferase family 4 protein n=1 Tax=Haploplasma modicum TaxID=2150 RepID=UPI00047BF266|nr:glycosyltransferase family 4 protein [Haploplasma modicum]